MKSVENKFHEALSALDKAGKRKQFDEKVQAGWTIETKLNCALTVLEGSGIVESITESGWSLTFKKAPPVKKNNGVRDNFLEGNPFNETRPTATNITEADSIIKEKEVTVKSLCESHGMTEVEARTIMGLPAKTPDGLTERQAIEYHLVRAMGLNEADATAFVKVPLVEVNRRF